MRLACTSLILLSLTAYSEDTNIPPKTLVCELNVVDENGQHSGKIQPQSQLKVTLDVAGFSLDVRLESWDDRSTIHNVLSMFLTSNQEGIFTDTSTNLDDLKTQRPSRLRLVFKGGKHASAYCYYAD